MSRHKENYTPEAVVLPAFLERNRIINPVQMAELLGFSVAHLRRMYRTGKIPAPKKIGGRKLGWPASVALELAGASIKEAA